MENMTTKEMISWAILLLLIIGGLTFVNEHSKAHAYTIVDTVYVPDSITVTMSWEEWERVKALLAPVASVEDREGAPTDTIFNYRNFIDTVSVWKDEYDTLFDWARDPDSDSALIDDVWDTDIMDTTINYKLMMLFED